MTDSLTCPVGTGELCCCAHVVKVITGDDLAVWDKSGHHSSVVIMLMVCESGHAWAVHVADHSGGTWDSVQNLPALGNFWTGDCDWKKLRA